MAGGWYWVDNLAKCGSVYGSITWWKDNASAVFPGIGELNKGSWRDGSAITCSTPAFICLRCFSVELPGYTGATWALPSTSPAPLTLVSGDHWTGTLVQDDGTYQIGTNCGTEQSGCQSVSIRSPSGAQICCVPIALNSTTHTYTYQTYPDVPGFWPGGVLTIQLAAPPSPPTVYASFFRFAQNVASITGTWSIPLPSSMPVIYSVIQFGTDVSGGALTDPGVLSGATKLLTTTSHRMTLFSHPGVAAGATLTIPTVSAADLTWVSAAAISGSFSNIFDEHQVIENGTSTPTPAMTVTSPAHTPGIQIYHLFQRRAAGTSGTVNPAGSWTGGDANFGPNAQSVVGGTPIFEQGSVMGAVKRYATGVPPWSSVTANFLHANGWDGQWANFH